MHKRQHSREFKLEVVRRIASGEKRPAQASREYGLAESVLSRWRKEYHERGEAAFLSQASPAASEESRIAELERFCGQLALENTVLKNIAGFEIKERHAMIAQAHALYPELSVQRLCDLFGVSRSWYYEQLRETGPDEEEIALRDEIERIILEFPGYGYRRVTRALHRAGQSITHKRVLRIMREESLLCHLKKRFVVKTTDSRHHFPLYPNALAGRVLTTLDQAWVADITYIRLKSAFVYLAAILDAFSRRCVGWHLSHEMTTSLTLAALHPAINARKPSPGLIHHSDRGVQYASRDYVLALEQIGAVIRMSDVDNPYDNAKAEAFFKTLKQEEVYLKDYRTFAEAQADLTVFIEQVYHVKRLHSSLGYLPPIEFEAMYASLPRS
jgi:putative transposase